MAGTILLGYDGTACSKAALDVACELAAKLDCGLLVGYGYSPYRGAGDIGSHLVALREHGEEATAEAVAAARERGIEAEAELVDDRPAPALARLAEARDADYIVIGTYGEKPLTGAILGATPHKLLPISSVPVVVVPAAE